MSDSAAFEWTATDGGLTPLPRRRVGEVLVADSWLVEDGSVLALGVHGDRFLASVEEAAPSLHETARAFWDRATAGIPPLGDWFPRLELVRTPLGVLVLQGEYRPAPARALSARLVTAAEDPRRNPLVKGPDLRRLGELRSSARESGADEAVLVDSAGFVAEGAYSSIVWWRNDALCLVEDDVPRLPGVTERALVTLATALGVQVLREVVTPDDLEGLEVWLLDSLNGIRIATSWVDGPSVAEEPGRLRLWRTRLAALARPIQPA
ncbi:aminotransferase class IV [Frondihabitans cladoniiphilus]|uniref:Aminotransferase class IV n=1 Tax=Frondihabitans cladoniiphilus TaxID=715785 RepID=A0ABP8VKK1_9MICO